MLIIVYTHGGAWSIRTRDPGFDIDAWYASRMDSFKKLGVYRVEYIAVPDEAQLQKIAIIA